ncbi:DUF2790 domain-containing protein [Pseudomonas rubra]|uniref:DUF2790 domain-containing protein n=1 Tax=Pseudomonas rubra TaxID=2942627 RepID=A0ABT5P9V6_9PSED|nr:DUF2790 domain-containing protein [Pseudomonas rubra]MDD1015090.1 DUF2790 domain-containing protein [Pseudomonas rubra]MDD1038575.1 DUF2790 domain-containing protein [Pseudomonas rubra]MDD1154733.1 DUF2790 domain-containing protein [Pseudomonas rubra]
MAAVVLLAGQSVQASAPAVKDARLVAHEQAVQAYAARTGKTVPAIQDFAYGKSMDVALLIEQTPLARGCDAAPMLMTFEDSSGQLVTMRYRLEGQCSRFQSTR